MPMRWRKQLEWQKEQENNLLYVALTRAKRSLFIVGEINWAERLSGERISDIENQEDEEELDWEGWLEEQAHQEWHESYFCEQEEMDG